MSRKKLVGPFQPCLTPALVGGLDIGGVELFPQHLLALFGLHAEPLRSRCCSIASSRCRSVSLRALITQTTATDNSTTAMSSTATAACTTGWCRRHHFAARWTGVGGRARIGSSARNRFRSSAISCARRMCAPVPCPASSP